MFMHLIPLAISFTQSTPAIIYQSAETVYWESYIMLSYRNKKKRKIVCRPEFYHSNKKLLSVTGTIRIGKTEVETNFFSPLLL